MSWTDQIQGGALFKIAVVSDTHLFSPDNSLIEEVENSFSHLDALVHCGDFVNEQVWAYLAKSHPCFHAVRGNMDSLDWAGFLPEKKVVSLDQVSVGILHGQGINLRSLPQALTGAFDEHVDLICFGHTHMREWFQADNGVHIVNPGSFRLPKDGLKSYAVVEINGNKDIQVNWHNI